jgi:hypothetical protein
VDCRKHSVRQKKSPAAHAAGEDSFGFLTKETQMPETADVGFNYKKEATSF